MVWRPTVHRFQPPDVAVRPVDGWQHVGGIPHLRGKSMSMEAIYPDGRVEMLSHVENFDPGWHVNYVYTALSG